MGLRDFFRAKREMKFASKNMAADSVLNDEEISQNWVVCKKCSSTIHRNQYAESWNVCPKCDFHGRLSVEQRIEHLTDTDSFVEIDADVSGLDPLNFVDTKPYIERLKATQKKTKTKDAITCGTAQINGIDVVLAIMNFDFIGGSMGSVVGEKLMRAIEKAIKVQKPIICVSSSGGARMHEGILSLMQMAKTSIALARLEEAGLPFISILTEPTFGGVAASYSSLGDLMIAEPEARIGFAGRRVIEETVNEKLPADFQTAEYLLKHGQVDMIVERAKMKSKLAQILKMLGFANPNREDPLKIIDAIPSASVNLSKKIKKLIPLDFEKPLLTIQKEIEHLEKNVKTNEDHSLLNSLKERYTLVEQNIYNNIEAIDRTKIARHPQRPYVEDYLNLMCGTGNWIELHGDRAGVDDQAILCALAEINGQTFIAVATRKGRNIKENQQRNFGMPQPEGYRKAKRIFNYANKFKLPVVTFIDTPGAYPGLAAEAHGQSIAIAENLKVLAGLTVPVIAVITGEGGSGGALAIGVANRVIMLENSIYSVISPEGCAAILWRTRDKAAEAAKALKITAKDLLELGIIDELIPEPLGGAHKDYESIANDVQDVILKQLAELKQMSPAELKEDRMKKFYSFGAFEEASMKVGR